MEKINTPHAEIMAAHIAACKASGMNVCTYCLKHNIKKSNYYYWLTKSQAPVETGKFISISAPITNVPVYITFINCIRVCFENMPPADYVKKLVS
ncbi:IS66 family insertion sequence element accessory protein TnpA [Ferruginibacter sp.]|uniref:IS66 family insertion sequence element accessory protein TnpA n=1 Tax=Ferruginibacter sp. TaxID=1940288 RepID=UPI00374DAC24